MKRGNRLAHIDGIWFVYPYIEDPTYVDVFVRNVYHFLTPRSSDIVFDIGAHIGFFSIWISERVKKVISFEPDPFNIVYLKFNTKLNERKNIIIVDHALGDDEKQVKLFIGMRRSNTRITEDDNLKSNIKVQMTTLDRFCESHSIYPDIIKIDVEGYELEVLKGGRTLLGKNKPRELAVAAYHYPHEFLEVVSFLQKFGYSCEIIDIPLFFSNKTERYIYATYY